MAEEKILCAEVTMPRQWQENVGIIGFTMKASEVESFITDELNNGDQKSFTVKIKYSFKTKKWIESLPEANI